MIAGCCREGIQAQGWLGGGGAADTGTQQTCKPHHANASLHTDTATHSHMHNNDRRKPLALIKKLRKAKKEAPAGEKPEVVRTHLRNMIIVPEMIGSIIGVYNGKTFNQVCGRAGGGCEREWEWVSSQLGVQAGSTLCTRVQPRW